MSDNDTVKCGHHQSILADLLCPEPYDHFFDKVVGERVLHLREGNAATRAVIIGGDPKTTILNAYERLSGTLTCHSGSARTRPPEAHETFCATEFLDLIHEYHRSGYTVRIPDATSLSPQLARLCRAIESIFENPASAVIFWSAAGADAPIHHDEYDLIAIQLCGRKRWFLSTDPPSLPNTWKAAGEGEPDFARHQVIDVAPGDLLYIPRGVAHTVSSTTESIHVAIGFVPVTVREVMAAAVDYLSEMSREIRAGVTARADALALGGGRREVSARLRKGLSALMPHCESGEFIEAALERRRARMIQDLPRLRKDRVMPHITPATRMRHDPLAIAHLLSTRNSIDLRLPGERILLHPGAEDAVRYILDTPEFRVADLPGALGEDVKVALVSRLAQSGFLEPSANLTADVVSLHHERRLRRSREPAKKRPGNTRPFPSEVSG